MSHGGIDEQMEMERHGRGISAALSYGLTYGSKINGDLKWCEENELE